MPVKSRQVEESNSGVWFFILLIVAIFVLYCLSMQRPYC
jgi:hypothetical protein